MLEVVVALFIFATIPLHQTGKSFNKNIQKY